MKNSNKRLGINIPFSIIHFCLMMTSIMFVWSYFSELIDPTPNLILKIVYILITGLGGLGLGLILMNQLGHVEDRIKQIKKDEK